MNTKNHRQNHNFQIAYFLAGSCHTADGAYALLCDLKEDRQTAIDGYSVSQLRGEAKEIRANKLLISIDDAEKKEGKADLLELENNKKTGKILYQAALDELDFIDKCIEVIQPLRLYKGLSDPEAHEASQHEEWKLELIRRAENSMLTSGGQIPSDLFDTMRMHPAFQKEIAPRLEEILTLLKTVAGREELQKQIKGSEFIEINKLLPTQILRIK
jgi:hypothetical protein